MTNLPPPLLILHSLRDLLASYIVSTVNMPPIPAVRPNKPLERGQTTIFSTLNGAISIQRGHVYIRLTNIGPWAYNPLIPLGIR